MINIKFGPLFPWHFRLLAIVALILSLGLIPENIWAGIFTSLLGLLALVAHEGTEINLANKTYREYRSFLFLKTGKLMSCPEIEKIFINKSEESQTIYSAHTMHSSTFEGIVYNAYLKFSNGKKIHLLKTKNKHKLINKLKSLSEIAHIEITDNS